MSEHTPVSSDDLGEEKEKVEVGGEGVIETGEMDLYREEVSIEDEGLPAEYGDALEEDEFEGIVDACLEEVEGFDESYALSEGMLLEGELPDEGELLAGMELIEPEEVPVSEALEAMLGACAEEFGPESVCGRDDRVRITATTRVPWRWNCQLIITKRNGSRSRCTGFFIGPRAVMTAGHCVYSHSAGGWARRIEVIPGMNQSSRPFGSQVATQFRSVRGWTRSRKPEYDYGCIILPNNRLGRAVGYFGFANLPWWSLQNLLVNNAGYAGDKPFGTLWFNAGRITSVTSRRLYYMIDTYGGHSGSPVWRYRNGKRHVVGIHGYGGCPNKAVRIIKPVFNNMLAWRRL